MDADAQPAKEAILSAAKKHSIKTVFVMSNAHYSEKNREADEVILVDNRKQEADIKIMNIAVKGDIAVTGDTGLGLFLAAKGVIVVSPRGKVLSEDELVTRNSVAAIEKKSLRAKKGKVKLRGPSKYTPEDRARLEMTIEKVILNNGGLL
ncbi:MAG: DUF188 domain-containing protein [Candidatus Goldiibacteriota bacterium]